MTDKNKIALILGIICVIVSFGCLLTSLYLSNQNPQPPGVSSPAEQLSQPPSARQKTDSHDPTQSTEIAKVQKKEASHEDYLTRARRIYGEEELNRKEGVLWVDPKDSSFVVTLGKVNGAFPGSHLNVYDGSTLITEAVIQSASDITAHVKFTDKTPDEFKKSYYKVVLKE